RTSERSARTVASLLAQAIAPGLAALAVAVSDFGSAHFDAVIACHLAAKLQDDLRAIGCTSNTVNCFPRRPVVGAEQGFENAPLPCRELRLSGRIRAVRGARFCSDVELGVFHLRHPQQFPN